jgi:hypothetical protein
MKGALEAAVNENSLHSAAQTTGIGSLTNGSGVGLSTAPAKVRIGRDALKVPICCGFVGLGGSSGDPNGGVCARAKVGTTASMTMASSIARDRFMGLLE